MIKRFRIGSVFGIPIEVDVSLLVIVPIIAWAIATDVTRVVRLLDALTGVQMATGPIASGVWPWLLGTLAALGLFCCVTLHELGHSLVAIRKGYDIDAIQLWLLGGVAEFAEQPDEWTAELEIAIAGPIVSILLGGLGLGILFSLPSSVPRIQFLAGYLGVLNLVLAGFNLLPGFPMDGGRILRALLSRNRPLPEATDLAATVGKVVAVGIGILGILSLDLLLLAIAAFVYLGATAEATQTRLESAFDGTTVGDLMTSVDSVETVSPDASVERLLDRMYRQRHTGYPVFDDGRIRGIVTLEDASRRNEHPGDTRTVADVMSTDLVTVSPDADAFEALEQMERNGIGRLIVTDDAGEMVGLISRSDLLRALAVARKYPETVPVQSGGAGLPAG